MSDNKSNQNNLPNNLNNNAKDNSYLKEKPNPEIKPPKYMTVAKSANNENSPNALNKIPSMEKVKNK